MSRPRRGGVGSGREWLLQPLPGGRAEGVLEGGVATEGGGERSLGVHGGDAEHALQCDGK